MGVTFPLLNGHRIGLAAAQQSEEDVIQRIAQCRGFLSATADLERQSNQGEISSLIAHHFGIDETRCTVEPTKAWPCGNFNHCIPIGVGARIYNASIKTTASTNASSRLLLRVPMAHKLVGMVDEKIRSEVATYVWMQENCPDYQYLASSPLASPTVATLVPWYRRWAKSLRRRICAWLGRPIPSYYVETPRGSHDFPAGYLLLEFIDRGSPLAQSWFSEPIDPIKRQNLFRGIARLILSLACVPLDRIGSFTFDADNGTISLSSRPLTCSVMILENDGARRVMDPDQTYETVDPYVTDLLSLHDNRFLAQLNAAKDRADCYYQMAIQAILRTMSHHYLDRSFRQGPFRMQFTDLHQGNLIVDDAWNITGLVDLEGICSRSPQMMDVPYWITSKGIDEVCSPEYLAEYAAAREDFMAAFKEEEEKCESSNRLSETLDNAYVSGATWFFHALDSVNAMYQIFENQLRPQFIHDPLPEEVDPYFAAFWTRTARDFAERKLRDKEAYDIRLKEMFQEGNCTGESGTQ